MRYAPARGLSGRTVRLTDERLAHILEHPEMAGMESAIADAVKRPERVVQSRTDAQSLLYYQMQIGTAFGDKWLCVVVKYSGEDAFIITAYLTASIKSGELLWPAE